LERAGEPVRNSASARADRRGTCAGPRPRSQGTNPTRLVRKTSPRRPPTPSGGHFQDVLQRRLLEDGGDAPLHLPEDAPHVAAAVTTPLLQVIEAAVKLDRPLQRLDDLTERDALRRPRQPEAAAESAPRADQPLGRKLLEDFG